MHNKAAQGVDANGQIISRTVNGITSYIYDGSHRAVSIVNPRRVTALSNTYTSGKVTSQRMPGTGTGTTTDDILNYYVYNSGSTIVRDTLNASSRQTTYTYNTTNNHLTQVSDAADCSATNYSFDATTALLVFQTNALGYKTSYSYTFANGLYDHLSKVIEHNNTPTTYSFAAPYGQLDTLTDAYNHTTNFDYDTKGSLTQVSTQLPAAAYFPVYNAYGQVEQQTDGLGRPTTYTYNSYRNLATLTAPSGITRNYTYDALSRVSSTYLSSASTQKTSFSYDRLDRIIKVTAPGNRITSFTYDDNSNLTSLTAPNGVRTVYTYNAQDQVASRKQAAYTESYLYNTLGQLSSTRDAKGQTTTYTYDLKGRVQKLTYQDTSSLTYTYDKLDRVTKVTDSTGSARDVAFTYTNDNSQIQGPLTVTSGTDTLRYTYDQVGNLLKVTRQTTTTDEEDPPPCEGSTCDPPPCGTGGTVCEIAGTTSEGTTTTSTDLLRYTYFPDDSLKQATLVGQGGRLDLSVTMTYNTAAEVTSLVYSNLPDSFPNFQQAVFYNAAGEVEQLQSNSGGTIVRRVSYFYDYAGKGELSQRTETGQQVPTIAANQRYEYNEVEELTCTATGSLDCTSVGTGNYTALYDPDGNPTNLNNNNVPAGAAYATGTNRMRSLGPTTLVSDANGNLIDDGTYLYDWNARGQLARIRWKANSALWRADFTYDALGRRIQKTLWPTYGSSSSTTTQFIYSGGQVIEEVTGGVRKRYLVGLGLDEVWASRVEGNASSDEYLLHDALNNSVTAVMGVTAYESGAAVYLKTGYGYTPFGSVSKSSTSSANNLLFGGHENDGTGLYYYRARYYSPVLQRFISEDPIGFSGGDTNLYRYVGNNPHVGSDATGLCGIECNSSAFSESVDSVFFEGGAVSERSPYRGYRPEGLPLPSGGRDGTLVPFAPALVVAPVVVDVAIAVGAAALFRAGLTYITGPAPQPALDGSVFRIDKPTGITDPKLQNTVDELFRKDDTVPGGTAGAIREEDRTSKLVGGKRHRVKGEQRARSIKKMLGRLSPSDRAIAGRVLQDLQDALGGQ